MALFLFLFFFFPFKYPEGYPPATYITKEEPAKTIFAKS